ncbi:MAG: hypothetical protein HYZ42_08555, partial [Bacteroidetes bacterium]|nr:hypothetical protein [Bacteroidota bacterium]
LVPQLPFQYTGDFGIEKLSSERAKFLIEHKILRLSVPIYNALRENFIGLQGLLVEKYIEDFIKDLEKYEIDGYDAEEFMKSSVISTNRKNLIIKRVNIEQVEQNSNLYELLGRMVFTNDRFELPKDLIECVLKYPGYLKLKINLLIKKADEFTGLEVMDILSTFPEPYSNISEKGKKPLLDVSDENKLMAQVLLSKGYISKVKTEKNGIRVITFRK